MKRIIVGLLLILLMCIGSFANEIHGPTKMTGPIDMGGYKIENMENNTALQGATTYSQMIEAGRSATECIVGPVTDFNSKFYNYVTDGTDDWVEISAAINTFSGGTVRLAPGKYNWGNASSVTIGNYTTLTGNSPARGIVWGTVDRRGITTINITDISNITFIRESNTIVQNLQFFYPNQNMADASPDVYPYTFSTTPGAVSTLMRDVDCTNAYDFSYSNSSDDDWYENVIGYPIHNGIYIYSNLDVSRISGIHFHPAYGMIAGSYPSSGMIAWIQTHGVGIELDSCNWGGLLHDNFCYGYYMSYYIKDSVATSVSKCDTDAGFYGVYVSGGGYNAIQDCHITTAGWGITSPSGSMTAITITGGSGGNTVSHNTIFASGGTGIALTNVADSGGVANNLVNGNNIRNWNYADSTCAAIYVASNGIGNEISDNVIQAHPNHTYTTFGIWIHTAEKGFGLDDNTITGTTNGLGIVLSNPDATNFTVIGNKLLKNSGYTNSAGADNLTRIWLHNVVVT